MSSPPMTAEVMPVMYQASHAGMVVMRYFSDPMRIKREADPMNEITRETSMLIIMLVMRSFLRRFLRAASSSCTYSFITVFISLKKASIISFIVGTIEGDVHDIGRQIIATMWAAAGYEVIDLGYDIPPKVFALKAKMKKADIIGISCSMGMARVGIGTTVEECEKAGIRNKVKIIDGGQAASYGDVETYKIDAFGAQTEDALKKASELMRILKEQKAQRGGD